MDLPDGKEKEGPAPFGGTNTYVRDRLAEYRTGLALRRTLLSYFRTSLAFFAGGLALIKFSGHPFATALGWALLPAGIFVLVQGTIVYVRMNRALKAEEEKAERAEKGVS